MFSIVIPTLGSRPSELKRLLDSLYNQTYKDFEIIMVIQDNYKEVSTILRGYNELNIHKVSINQKGLSNARNVAMNHVNGKYITFSDDDCWYPESALQEVSDVIINKEVCCFQYYDPDINKYPKQYSATKIDSLNWLELTGKSSIEIFINLDKVKKEDVVFDINYGLGSKYSSGEENIFLCDLKRKNYKISYIPNVIVYHAYTLTREITLDNWAVKTKVLSRMYKSKVLALILFTLMTFKRKNRNRIQNYCKAYIKGCIGLFNKD